MDTIRKPRVLLVYPPITDPTSPYHSLVYLSSYARSAGFHSIEILDTNIDWLHYCASPSFLEARLALWHSRLSQLNRAAALSGDQQLEYSYLLKSLALDGRSVSAAIATLKSVTAFHDYRTYERAAKTIALWLDCLSLEAFPGQFAEPFYLSDKNAFSLCSWRDMSSDRVLERIVGSYAEYFEAVLRPKLAHQAPDVIGINITYTAQLPFAIWLLRRIRSQLPNVLLLCGGTELSDLWKYTKSKEAFYSVLQPADACVIGEGETAFLKILESARIGVLPHSLPNTIFPRRNAGDRPSTFQVHYENVNELPTPDYSLMRTDQYFSPHTLVYYSPTRGCYWDKCTFCDYGHNNGRPTSPWRQRQLALARDDLITISRITRFCYFSVDVLAPGYLSRLAQEIVDSSIDIRWAAEVRLEKGFTPERCELLRRSGCVAVSVGFESGSQRILDLIQKGTQIANVEQTTANFSRSGIAVQMMGFTGFPTETRGEVEETFEFLEKNREQWSVAGIGNFVLTPGAILARTPKRFGIKLVRSFEGADIERALIYDLDDHDWPTICDTAKSVEDLRTALARTDFDRPFAGGIDSAHSVFYYDRYGTLFPTAVRGEADVSSEAITTTAVVLNGMLIEPLSFDPLDLFDADDLKQLHVDARTAGKMLSGEEVESYLGKRLLARSVQHYWPGFFLRNDGKIIPCSEELIALCRRVQNCEATTLANLAASVDENERTTVLHLIRFCLALRVFVAVRPTERDDAHNSRRQRGTGPHPSLAPVSNVVERGDNAIAGCLRGGDHHS